MPESDKIQFELDREEAAAVSNALNYFSHAIPAGECSTLTGFEQKRLTQLHRRLKQLLEAGS